MGLDLPFPRTLLGISHVNYPGYVAIDATIITGYLQLSKLKWNIQPMEIVIRFAILSLYSFPQVHPDTKALISRSRLISSSNA